MANNDIEPPKSGYAVEMLHITKTFGSLRALDDVNLRVKYGEVHAILGENGAGKSTLMSVLFGLTHADSGEIKVNGEAVRIKSPNDATELGIGMVHQHFKLVDVFSVLDNITLGHEDHVLGFLSKGKERKKVQAVVDKYNLGLNLNAKVKDISVALQQKTEICKVLYLNADIIILDEPTAVLTPQEIDTLMDIIRGFAKDGKAVILITHKLNEIKQVADTVTVLRRGRELGTFNVADCSSEQLAQLMVGKKVNFNVEKTEREIGRPILEIRNLSCMSKDRTKKALDNVSLTVHEGEVVAIAAIEGNGQEELMDLVTGLNKYPHTHGSIMFHGSEEDMNVLKSSISDRIKNGMSDIPSDRQRFGLIMDYDIKNNLVSKSLKKFSFAGFLRKGKIAKNGEAVSKKYDIRSASGVNTRTGDMSGGNQQKVIIGRELELEPKLLVSDQATRGLDVGAIEFVNNQIVKARDSGAAVLLYSTELSDIFNLATVIYVMYNGHIVARLDPKTSDYSEVGLYMGGGKTLPESLIQKDEAVVTVGQADSTPKAKETVQAQEPDKYYVDSSTLAVSYWRKNHPEVEEALQKGYGYAIFDRKAEKRYTGPKTLALKPVEAPIAEEIKQEVVLSEPVEEKKVVIEQPAPVPTVATVSKASDFGVEHWFSIARKATAPDDIGDIAQAIAQDEAGQFVDTQSAIEEKHVIKNPFLRFISSHSSGEIALLDSLVAVFIGLLLGFAVMLCINPSAAPDGFVSLFTAAFRKNYTLLNTLWYAGPLIVIGLCIAVPYKTGLFNIGASGQFTFAAVMGVAVGNVLEDVFNGSYSLLLVVALTCIIAGMVYAAIPGILKATFNVNEVISGIMLNWIAVFIAAIMIPMNFMWDPNVSGAKLKISGATIPTAGLDKLGGFLCHLDIGIIIAVVVALILLIVMSLTTYGYKLRACGLSKDASKYAGYSSKSYIVSSMLIAGALAGLCALLYYFTETPQSNLMPAVAVSNMGFDGISVAMIANCNPAGCVLSGLFLSMLRQSSNAIQVAGFDGKIVDVIMGVVIYAAAAAKIVAIIIRKISVKRELKMTARATDAVTAERSK